MSKGGSTTSQVQIPSYLSDAARRNLARADVIGRIGYTPYFGPDVAAMTPMQQAAIQGTNQMASAFGLPSVSDPMAGMPQPQDFGGMQAYSSAPMYEQSLQQLAQQRPAQYQAIESMFNPTGVTSYGGGYGGGYGSGGGYSTTTSGGGVSASDLAGTALAGYGAYKAIPAVASKVGGLLGLGSNAATDVATSTGLTKAALDGSLKPLPVAVENLAPTAVSAGSNLVPGVGTIRSGGDGFNYVYDAVLKDPALQGVGQEAVTTLAPETAKAVGAFGTGGTSGIGALPTASQLAYVAPYLTAPLLLDPVGKYVISPIADALGFGAEERAKRAELEKWSEESGFNDYKGMVESVSGMPYGDYIKSKMPPLSPYEADLQSLQSSGAGDMSYEEDQLLQFYQTPQGKQKMADFYAANPDWYTPTGERVFSGGLLGDMDRASAEWFAGGQKGSNPMAGTIKNVLNRSDYPILTKGRGGV